jgi:hypothetical protein
MVGRGAHAPLGIIITQVEYDAISAMHWVEPFNPGAIPNTPPGTKTVDAAQITRMRDEFRRIYTHIINVEQALHYTVCLSSIKFNTI